MGNNTSNLNNESDSYNTTTDEIETIKRKTRRKHNKKAHKGGADINFTEESVHDVIYKNHEIKGEEGSHFVKFKLNEGQSIKVVKGSLIYLKGNINPPEVVYDGFMKTFAGEHIVHQKYTASTRGGIIALGSNFINSVICLQIAGGNTFRISRHSFLACTENITISYTVIMQGILDVGQGEGFVLPTATCIGDNAGYIWLSSYGSYDKIVLEDNESVIVDNGMFLACRNDIDYTVELIGNSVFSSFMGGEGFGMQFMNNGKIKDDDGNVVSLKIYVQTKNENDFLQQVSTGNSSVQQEVSKGVVKGIFEGMFNQDGGSKIRAKLRNI